MAALSFTGGCYLSDQFAFVLFDPHLNGCQRVHVIILSGVLISLAAFAFAATASMLLPSGSG